jgi:ComF family protein
MSSYSWVIDIVIPVPLGSQRERQRGYNQAALIALPLALKLQLPYNPRILKRIRETQSQVELSLKERQINLEGAFHAQRQPIDGKQILIIDDVTTSGSTLNACAEALIEVGAKAVYGLTIAQAVHKNA